MASRKMNDLKKMSKEERQKKMEEMKFELVKSKVSAAKTGSSRIKEIKKIIARMLTLDKLNK
ncbi:MAG TPA: 50S ribosomal protein L29 [Candidatus Pacearchaeota archaeon]|nr:50S ribosomal protein L29 [Candidatus Pacearchaeota archaeon]